ncbi:hypothetical protein AB0M29_02380 [Streptomyces sp. NPDC051976]|uniref:hypothetical protein n=1 Tax=Streptomyces sp. NPDC051976 TaxID=3154947 RepID=UPI003425569B
MSLAGFRRAAVAVVALSALTAACSGGSGSTQPSDPPSSTSSSPTGAPAPAPTTPSATGTPTPDPSMTAELVSEWFGNGGEQQLRAVSADAADLQAEHQRGAAIIDFTQFFSTVHTAQHYAPVPDRATQSLWSTALKDLNDGAGDVYESAPLGSGVTPDAAHRKREAKGWTEFEAGVKALKSAEARLHYSFHLDLSSDPWESTS